MEEIRKNPDISKKEILKKSKKSFLQYALNSEQKERIEEIVDNFEKKHETIEELLDGKTDIEKMFEKIFKFKPKGKIEFVKGSVSIGFACSETEDFTKSSFGKDDSGAQERSMPSGTIKRDVGIPGLENAVILVDKEIMENDKKEGINVNSVIQHEEQHAINAMFYKRSFDKEKWSSLLQEAIEENDIQKKELLLKRHLRADRVTAEPRAIDEIISYYKEGTNPIDVKL